MTTMWDNTDDTNIFQFDCDECNGNYQLPPPKFHIPPPPIPSSLKDFIKCNEDDFINRINKWDNDMCDAIPTFDASFLSSPFAHTLILVAIFSFILILVIILSVIYVRRLIKEKNGGCKELKNLVKHHLHKTNTTNSNLQKLPTTDNYYDECYHCNEYTISRQAKDFIGYTVQTTTIEGQNEKRTSATSTIRTPSSSSSTQITLFNPENYFHSRHNDEQQHHHQHHQQLSQNFYQYSIYNEFSGYFNEPISRANNYFNQNHNYLNNQINYNNQDNLNYDRRQFYEYSRTYEDFIELNNSTSPSTTITDDCSSGNDCHSNSNPEYVEIELVVPNLVLR